jgi:Gas vesicle protein K
LTPRKRTPQRPSPPQAASRRPAARSREVTTLPERELRAMKLELEGRRKKAAPSRWNADPEDVQRSVARLVLALCEFLRKILERQAIRRMEERTLTPDEVEKIGLALMRLEQTLHDIAGRFGLTPDELNLDLGPLGKLI